MEEIIISIAKVFLPVQGEWTKAVSNCFVGNNYLHRKLFVPVEGEWTKPFLTAAHATQNHAPVWFSSRFSLGSSLVEGLGYTV